MGIKNLQVFSCDAPGCDVSWTGDIDDLPEFIKIVPTTIKMKEQTLWTGYLCAPCENKFYNAIVKAIGPAVTNGDR